MLSVIRFLSELGFLASNKKQHPSLYQKGEMAMVFVYPLNQIISAILIVCLVPRSNALTYPREAYPSSLNVLSLGKPVHFRIMDKSFYS